MVERPHESRRDYSGGHTRHNKLYRQVLDRDGTPLYEELMVENYALMMYSPLIEAGEPEENTKEAKRNE